MSVTSGAGLQARQCVEGPIGRWGLALAAGAALLTSTTGGVQAQSCEPMWSEAFSSGYFDEDVRAIVRADIGGASSVIATGHFTRAGGRADIMRIASWDGYSWQPFGAGLEGTSTTHPVGGYALAVYDDGAGPELYLGGVFESVDGVAAANIARWDGTAWFPLGDGVDEAVRALTVFDDGSGPALYVGGLFETAGGLPAQRIARFRHGQWAALGELTGERGVYSLYVHDDGSGEALYVGGDFTHLDGQPVHNVVRYGSAGWSSVGPTPPPTVWESGNVLAMTAFDDGSGPRLFAGGRHGSVGGSVIVWDGGQWTRSPLPGGGQFVAALKSFDDGSGPALYAGGTSSPARYRDGVWMHLPSTGTIRCFVVDDDGGETELWFGGSQGPGRWDGQTWRPWSPPRGITSLSGQVEALRWYDDGTGPALYAGGSFSSIGELSGHRLARWDGTMWSAVGDNLPSGTIYAIEPFDDGGGSMLYVGGIFAFPPPAGSQNLARWDGAQWSSVYSFGPMGAVRTLRTLTFGGERRLYVGGSFDYVGLTVVNGLFAWDGQAPMALGTGFTGPNMVIHDVAVFAGTAGEHVYAVGQFTQAGNVAANGIARWDGMQWEPLGAGLTNALAVRALAVMDAGSGPRLYVGGQFTGAGGQPAQNIAAWDGAMWHALPAPVEPISDVRSLAVFQEDREPKLLVGAQWPQVWDGQDWSRLVEVCPQRLQTIEVVERPGEATDMFFGGSFRTCFGPRGAAGIALRIGCHECYANCDNSTNSPALNIDDFMCFINQFSEASLLPHEEQVVHYANCDGATTAPVLTVNDFTCFINRFAAGCP